MPSFAAAVSVVGAPWALGPSAVVEAPPTVRATASFLLTVLFGGFVLYRYGGRLDEAVEAATARPLVSVVYGVVAFGIVTFAVVYVFSQLARARVGIALVRTVSTVLLGVALSALAGLGFAVVGTWVTELTGLGDPWVGLVGTSALGALAWLLLPFTAGALVWLAIAAAGLGGPTRLWIHESTVRAERT